MKRDAGDGEAAVGEPARIRLLCLRRSEILLLTYRSLVIYMASLSGVAEPITRGEGGGG